jgi:lysophospholipase L1-like esterase
MRVTVKDSSAGKDRATRRRGLLRVLAICSLLIVAFLGITEAILRFVLGLGNPVLITRDSACGYIIKPDQRVRRFSTNTRINHYGMRSEEVPPSRDPNRLRIMFVGDSLTYGTTRVDQCQIFTEILHRELPSIVHKPVDVLNASAGAWAPDNEVSYIRSRGIFQSDVVVFVLNDGDLTQPRATVQEVGDDLPSKRPATAIGELWSRYLKELLLHAIRRRDAGTTIAPNADEVVQANLRDLDAADALVTAQGARIVIVFLPFRLDVPDKSAQAQTTLRDWCAAHHVPMLDMTATELPYSISDLDLDNGYHFNARGNAIVAKGILELWSKSVGEP